MSKRSRCRACCLLNAGLPAWLTKHVSQDDSDFFSSQGSINSLDDQTIRKEGMLALDRNAPPQLTGTALQWPGTGTSAALATAPQKSAADSASTDMLVRVIHSLSLTSACNVTQLLMPMRCRLLHLMSHTKKFADPLVLH